MNNAMNKKILTLWHKLTQPEMLKYLFFGILTTIVSYIVYALCIQIGLSTFWSNTCSTAVGILFAYVTNKLWVFNARCFAPAVLIPEFLTFVSGRLVTYVVETAMLYVTVDKLRFNAFIMKMCTMVFVVVANYIISKKAVFREKR